MSIVYKLCLLLAVTGSAFGDGNSTTREFLNMRIMNPSVIVRQKSIHLIVRLHGHPAPNFTILKNGEELLLTDKKKYDLLYMPMDFNFIFSIKDLNVADNAIYTINASNGVLNHSETYQLQVGAEPVLDFGVSDKICVKGTNASFKCDVSGYPMPNVNWMFSKDGAQTSMDSTNVIVTSLYTKTAFLHVPCSERGIITCLASNSFQSDVSKSITCLASNSCQSDVSKSRRLLAFDMIDGFRTSNKSGEQELVMEKDL